MKTIFLIGFMGSGKSTFGKKLAAKLKLEFIDLDERVNNENSELSIEKLIKGKGIDFFRKEENRVLKTLPVTDNVIATGGGTPCYFDGLEWMKQNGIVVFLNAPEEVIYGRLLTTELKQRPLIKDLDEDGLKKFIHEKLGERMSFYTQAHIYFNPVNEKMEELIQKLNFTTD